LLRYAEFMADFHHVYIQARKDPDHKWFELPYLDMNDTIAEVIKRWLAYWDVPSDEAVGTSKSAEKTKKEVTKQKV